MFHGLRKSLSVTRPISIGVACFYRLVAQRHYALHRRDALRTDFNALHTARAVPDTTILVQTAQARCVGVIARVRDEAIRLRQRRRSHKVLIYFKRCAVGHACAAHDATHYTRKMHHILVGHDVLGFGYRAVMLQPWLYGAHLVPVNRHIGDEVLDDGHIAHRLNHDGSAVSHHINDLRVAGKTRLSVDSHPARPANRASA